MKKRGSFFDYRSMTVTENRGCKNMDPRLLTEFFAYGESDGYDSDPDSAYGYQQPGNGYQPDGGFFEIVVPPGKPRRKPVPVCIVKYRLPWPTGRDLLHMFIGVNGGGKTQRGAVEKSSARLGGLQDCLPGGWLRQGVVGSGVNSARQLDGDAWRLASDSSRPSTPEYDSDA